MTAFIRTGSGTTRRMRIYMHEIQIYTLMYIFDVWVVSPVAWG